MAKTYVHLTATNAKHETRLMKEASVAIESGLFDRVRVVAKKGRGDDALEAIEEPATGVVVERAPVRRRYGSFISQAIWSVDALVRVISARPVAISVHHVMLLPLGVIAKAFTGAALVYDAHELETESASLVGRTGKKRLLKVLERTLIRFCSHTIVVGEGIASWYRTTYPGLRVSAIYNYPRRLRQVPEIGRNRLRDALSIPASVKVFIYQGVLEPDRGLPLLLQVFKEGRVPGGVLVTMGYGSMEAELAAAAAESPHVRFLPAVHPSEILSWTSGADVGLILCPAACLSYELSMPNKLFEYIQARIPVIVSDQLTEMSTLVSERGIGQAVALTPDAVARTLTAVAASDWPTETTSLQAAAEAFVWEREAARLEQVYLSLGAGQPRGPAKAIPNQEA